MTTHSKLSPSSRHRWSACPASVREEAKYPSKPGGPAAIDGTHTHTLLEKCIKETHDAKTYVGMILKDHEGEFIVDAERAERVQFALDYIEKRAEALDCLVVRAERKVDPAVLVGRADMSGTVDVTLLSGDGDDLEIIDYKDGMNAVDAEGNHQMEQYAIGVLAEMGRMPLRITMTIIQPKLRVKGLSGISTTTVNLGQIMQVKDKLIMEGAAADAPDAPYVPGEKQCRYCAHAGACSALSNKALGDAGITFQNLDVVKQSADKEPGAMTNQQLREIIEAAPLLRQMIEGAEEEALKRLKEGIVIEGLKAVRGSGMRKWAIDDEEVMVEKLKAFKIPADVIYKKTLITLPKVLNIDGTSPLRWKKRDGTECQLSPRQLEILQNEYTKKTEGKISVASESDPRPAVTLSAAPMFSAVPPVVTVESELPSFLR